MITENLSTLKIHKLTQAQYERERDAGRIDESALYLTPDEDVSYLARTAIVSHNADTNAHSNILKYCDRLSAAKDGLNERVFDLEEDVIDIKAHMMQQTPLYADSIEGCTDTSKLYVLPDGYIYACAPKTVEGGKVPNFTNALDTATIHINKRFNSSDELKDAAGYVAIDFIPVKVDNIVRVNRGDAFVNTYCRIKYYDSNKTRLSTLTDAQANKEVKITVANGISSFTAGYLAWTANDLTNMSKKEGTAYMRLNVYVSNATITKADIADLAVTVNQEISYTTTEDSIAYEWQNTRHSFVPADYEGRIVELETAVDALKTENDALTSQLAKKSTNALSVAEVFAPSPQLPADGSSSADFDAETISCADIYEYIDALVTKYPKYITKQVVGKDESDLYDWNRYVLCRRYYDAWQKVKYPKMYAWTSGSNTVYSVSVSPRIGDSMFSTAEISTIAGTVTAVDNANQTRTIGSGVYTRDKSKDVEPALVYTETYYSPSYVGTYANFRNAVYNSDCHVIGTIATYSGTSMKDSIGNEYVRYPLGDRNSEFKKPEVIVIGSNEHGRPQDPAEPAIISARMIKDLCECVNANNPFLNLLKNNYMVVFCPVINPWGFSDAHKSYYNANGINIDRNFDTVGWGNDTTSGPQGSYGGSENETQYFMNTIVESGAKIVTANHCLGAQTNTTGESTNAGICHWMLGRNNTKYTGDLNAIGMTMSANYNLAFTDYGEAPPETYAKTRSYIASVGAEGGAVEMQAREGFLLDGDGDMHTSRILEADYTLLLQFLHMLIDKSE